MHNRTVSLAFAVAAPIAMSSAAFSQPGSVTTSAGELSIEQLESLEFPWGMTMLPDQRLLITEKPGRLRIWQDGELSEPVSGVPEVVYRGGPAEQGGLLDVAVDPDFENNGLVYLSFVEAADQQPEEIADTGDARFADYLDMSDDIVRGGAVARARLEGNSLSDLEVIWRQTPKTVGRGHFGHRLLFGPDGMLYISSGERMRFDPAQSLSSNLGKIVRINSDGSIPEDNPFVDQEEALGEIWSYGHRNVLASEFHPESGQLWAFEMGPLGGDEVNLIEAGQNYGWPSVSNGSDYGRQTIPSHPGAEDYQAPVRTWTPVVSPSGAHFYHGGLIADWQGDLLVGGLSSQSLVRLELDGERIAVEERIPMEQRIRDVIQADDGALLLIVDAADGALLRLTPSE